MNKQESMRAPALPAELLAEVSIVLRKHGYLIPDARKFTAALASATVSAAAHRDEETAAELAAANREVAQAEAADPMVWVATVRRNVAYHRYSAGDPTAATGCQRSMRTGEQLRLSELLDRVGHAERCLSCWTVDDAGAGTPAERIAGVAQVAPDPDPVAPRMPVPPVAAAVDAMNASMRRAMRWQQVSEAVAAGLAAAPSDLRISDDGWSLALTVESPDQVAAWAAALAVGVPEVRVYSPARGAVVRETSVARSHPFATRIACVETLPGAPPAAARVAADAFADAGVVA